MKFNYHDKKYEVNWIEEDLGFILMGATCLSFKTSGIPADIFFGQTKDGKLKIVGKWGMGDAYRSYIVTHRRVRRRRLLDLMQAHKRGGLDDSGYRELAELVREVK